MEARFCVQTIIQQLVAHPIDMLGINAAASETAYLNYHQDSYTRTVRDIETLCQARRGNTRILEIGSFLGVVSIALKELGYQVEALDIPEFSGSAALRTFYQSNGVPLHGVNLRDSALPFQNDSFEVVILCEVIEHLNFNPLPLFQEVHRVLSPGGYLYLAMPNQASLKNRLSLLRGKSIHQPIADFFHQLDPHQNMSVGLHWREYTLEESQELLTNMGFETLRKAFFFEAGQKQSIFFQALRRFLYLYPPFRPFQVVIARKSGPSPTHFVHPSSLS